MAQEADVTSGKYYRQYAYYERNKEAILAKRRAKRQANLEEARRKDAERRERDRDKQRVWQANWQKANPNKRRENQRRREQQLTGKVDYDAVWDRDKGVCHICEETVEFGDHHFDHVIPLSEGGEHSFDNVKVAHALCNLRKGPKLLEVI